MSRQPASASLTPIGKLAIGASAVAAIVLLLSLASLVLTLFVPSAASQRDPGKALATVEKYKAGFGGYIAQLDGRSLFFAPKKPEKEVEAPHTEPDPAATTKVTSYGGPRVIGMVNDFVWFDDGTRRKIGAEKEDDLAVKAFITPWEALVEWKGVPFTIGFFSRDGLIL